MIKPDATNSGSRGVKVARKSWTVRRGFLTVLLVTGFAIALAQKSQAQDSVAQDSADQKSTPNAPVANIDRSVNAVDRSTHAEVDGQSHDAVPLDPPGKKSGSGTASRPSSSSSTIWSHTLSSASVTSASDQDSKTLFSRPTPGVGKSTWPELGGLATGENTSTPNDGENANPSSASSPATGSGKNETSKQVQHAATRQTFEASSGSPWSLTPPPSTGQGIPHFGTTSSSIGVSSGSAVTPEPGVNPLFAFPQGSDEKRGISSPFQTHGDATANPNFAWQTPFSRRPSRPGTGGPASADSLGISSSSSRSSALRNSSNKKARAHANRLSSSTPNAGIKSGDSRTSETQ